VKNIFITGSTGFVGENIIKYFNTKFNFYRYLKNEEIKINQDIVLHFAGKAHDLKNITNVKEYYVVNTELTKEVFDNFLISSANVFIFLSSVKAVTDDLDCELTESFIPKPVTDYGKSKLLAEQYITSRSIPNDKRVYILRPCMIHGEGNKGNLNLLFNIIKNGYPWPLGAFNNKRSFCSIDNLCFIINELIQNDEIPSGIYNIADDVPLSTNEIVSLISKNITNDVCVWYTPKNIIVFISKLGDILRLPLNSERLNKLTQNYIISNKKIVKAINKPLPFSSEDGLIKTFKSFYDL